MSIKVNDILNAKKEELERRMKIKKAQGSKDEGAGDDSESFFTDYGGKE